MLEELGSDTSECPIVTGYPLDAAESTDGAKLLVIKELQDLVHVLALGDKRHGGNVLVELESHGAKHH